MQGVLKLHSENIQELCIIVEDICNNVSAEIVRWSICKIPKLELSYFTMNTLLKIFYKMNNIYFTC